MRPSVEERFWAKVAFGAAGGCWLWTGSKSTGYGLFAVGSTLDESRRKVRAHRWSYEALKGAIPAGLDLDHLCRVRACVNPDHLEPVTRGENARRGDAGAHLAAKTHCPQGHPYSGDNLYIRPSDGARECRTCKRETTRRRRAT
jgi:hypothetical protein